MKLIYNKLNKMRTPIRFLKKVEFEGSLMDFYISKTIDTNQISIFMLRNDETNVEEGIEITLEKYYPNSTEQTIVFDYTYKSEDFLNHLLTIMIKEDFLEKDKIVYKKNEVGYEKVYCTATKKLLSLFEKNEDYKVNSKDNKIEKIVVYRYDGIDFTDFNSAEKYKIERENLLKDKIKKGTEKILKYNSVKLLKSTGKLTKFKIGNKTFLFVVDFDNFGVLKTRYGKYYEILGNDKGKLKLRRVMIANNPDELIINKEKHGQTYLEMSRILKEKLSKINLPKLCKKPQ